MSLKKVCRYPTCHELLDMEYMAPAYCPKHRKAEAQEKVHTDRDRGRESERPSASERGYNHKWRKMRQAYIAEHPLCAEHQRMPAPWNLVPVAAQVVDHVVPVVDAPERQYDWTNLESLCTECHNRKTAREKMARARPGTPVSVYEGTGT